MIFEAAMAIRKASWCGYAMAAGLLVALIPQGAAAKPEKFKLDPDHISIGFLVSHAGYARQLGLFREASGSFTLDMAARNLTDVRVVIEAESVFTNNRKRDEHLRSADFLNAREFPRIIFTGERLEPTGDMTGRLHGKLDLRGRARPVVLDLTLNKKADYPFGGGVFSGPNHVVGISARGVIRRREYGMTYALDGLVGDEIELIIEFEAIRQ